jgi:uncharacterized protein (TIGR03067 family)
MYRNILMIGVVALLGANSFQGDIAKDDLEKMKGDWTLVSTETNAKKRTAADFKEFSRKVTGETYEVTIETEEGVQSIGIKITKLDSAKSPKTIDVEMTEGPAKGKTFRGIYKFVDDTQVICLAAPDNDRPTKFDSKEGTVTVWKRAKAPAKEDAQSAGDKTKKELADLQGIWRLVGFEVDGKEAFLQEHKQIRWVIKNDKVFYGGDELAKLTLDPAANPKCLDLDLAKSKRIHEGIYKLDKDRLKICVGMMTEGVKDRPLKFDNDGIDKYRTLIFERDKPGTELEGAAGFVGIQLRLDDKTKEIQIVDTIKDSPAEKAGFKKDDVLLKVGTDATGDLLQTVNLVRQLKPGTEAVMRVRRAGKEHDIKVKVGVAPFLFLDS